MRTIGAKFAIAALGACLAVAALAGPATANTYTNGFKLARFKVEVKGYQTTVQQHTHAAEGECDVDDFSSGSERVSFRSVKPMIVTATYFPGQFNAEFFSGKRLGIPTRATVKRSYTPRISASSTNLECGANGGGVDTVYQPDCGTKTVNPYLVKLEYAENKADRNKLLLTTYSGAQEPFERCPGAGPAGFPYLIVENGHAKWISAELSQAELFSPRFRQWISIADGSQKIQSSDYWTKTKIHWEVSFIRLKNKVPGI